MISASTFLNKFHPNAIVLMAALLSITIQYSLAFTSITLFPSHNSRDAFLNPNLFYPPTSLLDRVVFSFRIFSNWDGQYFLWIAEHGYKSQSHHAFFPLYPLCVRLVSKCIHKVFLGALNSFSSLILAGLLISNTAFILSALILYRLSLKLFKSRAFALNSAFAFCFNFARIFMSSVYTESLFILLSFGGFYCYLNDAWLTQKLFSANDLLCCVLFALSASTRSNGILFAGFFLYRILVGLLSKKKLKFLKASLYLLYAAVIVCPFVFINFFGYRTYCGGGELDAGDFEFCGKIRFYQFYSFLQSKYWNVGFVKSYRVRKIPNILLAAPIIAVSTCALRLYIQRNPARFFTAGAVRSKKASFEGGKGSLGILATLTGERLLVFHYYWLCLLALSVFFINIRVAGRFMSGVPLVYWYSSYCVMSGRGNGEGDELVIAKWLIVVWFCVYFVLGAILFPLFVAWL